MLRHTVRSLALAVVATLALAGPALAGGWAVTTFDTPLMDGVRAGESHRVGYTIRQHGQRPYPGANTEIIIRSSSGETRRFAGRPEGAEGHYVANVTFPEPGQWEWEVTQEPFAPQKLGTLLVASSPSPADLAQPALASLRPAMLLGALLALALFGWRLTLFARARTPDPYDRLLEEARA